MCCHFYYDILLSAWNSSYSLRIYTDRPAFGGTPDESLRVVGAWSYQRAEGYLANESTVTVVICCGDYPATISKGAVKVILLPGSVGDYWLLLYAWGNDSRSLAQFPCGVDVDFEIEIPPNRFEHDDVLSSFVDGSQPRDKALVTDDAG